VRLTKAFSTWDGTIKANVAMAGAIFLLAGAVALQEGRLSAMHERVVLVPPQLTSEAQVGWDEASKDFYEGWGLYAASMIGSVTPKTASFVANHLQFIFDERIYPAVKTQLKSIEKDPVYAAAGAVNVFAPRTVTWEASTKTVFVSGLLTTTAYRAQVKDVANLFVTYQMNMQMKSGLPKITSFTSYVGQARTMAWLKQHPNDTGADKEKDDQSRIIPQESEIQKALESKTSNAADMMPQDDVQPDAKAKPQAPAASSQSGQVMQQLPIQMPQASQPRAAKAGDERL
jgi:conjugal transfer pilus assembly protein TraE